MSAIHLKLSEVPRRLLVEFNVSIPYRRLYQAVLDGLIPAHRDGSGARWLVDASDLLLIAQKLSPSGPTQKPTAGP